MATNTQSPQKLWNPVRVRILGLVALFLPIVGATLYHIEDFSAVGQARFALSFGRVFIIAALLSMLLMPKAFRQILDVKHGLDEFENHRRTQTYFHSYKLILLVVFLLLIIVALAANEGMGGKQMRSLLVTISTMILAYSMVIPYNILAWTLPPSDEE